MLEFLLKMFSTPFEPRISGALCLWRDSKCRLEMRNTWCCADGFRWFHPNSNGNYRYEGGKVWTKLFRSFRQENSLVRIPKKHNPFSVQNLTIFHWFRIFPGNLREVFSSGTISANHETCASNKSGNATSSCLCNLRLLDFVENPQMSSRLKFWREILQSVVLFLDVTAIVEFTYIARVFAVHSHSMALVAKRNLW